MVLRHSYRPEHVGFKLRVGNLIKMGKVILRVKEIFTRKHVRSVNKRETNYNTVVPNKDHGYTIYGNIQDENINIRNEPQGCIVNEQFNLNPIKQISISEEYKDTNRYEDLNILNLNKPKKRIKKKDILCRICLNEECEDDNPLIYPCKCSGTMRYIHLECLKLWLKTKIVTKTTEHMILQTYKNLSCELCKESIPDKLKVHNEIIYLYDFQKPDSNYLILESMLKESDGTTCLYVIDMKNKDMLKLGRGNDCDVRISDISVSRSHSILRYYDDDFYLTDIQSKFGTLVDIYDIISVIYKCPLGIQIGKVFMQFTLKKTIWSCLKCYYPKHKGESYNEYFEDMAKNDDQETPMNDYVANSQDIYYYASESAIQSLKIKKDSENSNLHSQENEQAGIENQSKKSNVNISRQNSISKVLNQLTPISSSNKNWKLRRIHTRNFMASQNLYSSNIDKNITTQNIMRFGSMHIKKVKFKKPLIPDRKTNESQVHQEYNIVESINSINEIKQDDLSKYDSSNKIFSKSRSYSNSSHEVSICQNLVNNIFSNIQPNMNTSSINSNINQSLKEDIKESIDLNKEDSE